MAASIASMATLNAKCFAIKSPPSNPSKPTTLIRPISLLSLRDLPKGLSISKPAPLTSAAIAGAIFSTLSHSDAAFAVQQIAEIADGDSRGTALLLPLIPAVLWVLYNIFRPAVNQLDRMRSERGLIVGLGVGSALAAAGLMSAPSASAAAGIAALAEVSSSSDSRGLLVLFVVALAIAWVLFNILQPALNQINRMRS